MAVKTNGFSDIEARLQELGLVLPSPLQVPAGVKLPFAFVRVRGNRAFVSGHGPQNPDGSVAHPRGKVGASVPGTQACRTLVCQTHLFGGLLDIQLFNFTIDCPAPDTQQACGLGFVPACFLQGLQHSFPCYSSPFSGHRRP